MKLVRGYTRVGCFSDWFNDAGELICHAVEKPWENNAPFVSCIPEGAYGLVEYASPKFGQTWAMLNHELGVGLFVGDSDRYACLIHKANWPHQVQGCIAPVSEFTVLGDKWAGSSSRAAYDKVIDEIEGGDTVLEITHAVGKLA
jgi:hypothetical protein